MGVPMHVRKCPTFGFERSQEIETMIGCRRWIEEKILASNFQRWLNAIPSDTEVDPPFFCRITRGYSNDPAENKEKRMACFGNR